MVEAIQVGFQFPLPGEFQTLQVPVIDTPVDEERALKLKRELLLRILSREKDDGIYQVIERIEANFKAGGTRENMYFYPTQRGGRKEVLATPEDLEWVLVTRRNTTFERQTNR